ncbi:MAG: Rpn family recombination-promoting nuclease/putative transposase [Arsenophonus sp. NEOnobi-MAG3]
MPYFIKTKTEKAYIYRLLEQQSMPKKIIAFRLIAL